MNRLICSATVCAALLAPTMARAAIVINEFVYDDGGTDDREFVELYNNGAAAVDISGWTVTGQDVVGANAVFTITGAVGSNTTVLAPNAYYVIGQTGVLTANQTQAGSFLENDAETVELRNGSTVVDAVLYEANKGAATASTGYGVLPAPVAADVGPGIWGNHQTNDIAAAPATNATSTLARFVSGRDTNNNGRDFGLRPPTPGATNNPVNITSYNVPSVTNLAPGTALSNYGYSFVPPRAINPAVVDADNPNAIPNPPNSNRAWVAWDSSGGGNAVSAPETFNTAQSRFDIYAYLDTRDFPQNSNAAGTLFRGSEFTIYGIGGLESLNNLTDISGQVGAPDTANGTTGVAWIYEKVQAPNPADPLGPTNLVSEKLYLVDAGDGGDAGQGGTLPFDWTILATVDLSATTSGWHRLGISINAAGVGVARYDNQLFNFTTGLHSGAFGVAYRENLQIGADATPDALMRPPTYVQVPEPATFVLVALGLLTCVCGRRR